MEDHEPAQSAIGWSEIGNCNEVTAVYNGESLAAFYQNILGEHTTFPSCTWLRAKGHGEVTAEHVDYYYFRQNTQIFSEHMENKIEHNSNCQLCYLHANDHDSNQTVNCALCTRIYHTSCLKPKPKKMAHNLKQEGEWHCDECAELAFPYWTCWISMGNVTSEDGRLAVQPGSHTQLTGYNCPSRVGLTPESYTPKHEKKQKWFTSTFGPGDIVLFNVKLIHAATKNTSTKFRISCDSRVTKHQQDNSC